MPTRVVTELKSGGAFCVLPWIHFELSNRGDVYPCCAQVNRDFSYGRSTGQDFEEIWNSGRARSFRREMLAGRLPRQCRTCKDLETAGAVSTRLESNVLWKEVALGLLESAREDGTADVGEIRSLDIRFSNLCNFRCRSCNPETSTGWASEAAIQGVTDAASRPVEIPLEALKMIEPLLPRLTHIYFAGGEPLLHERHYLFLQRLLDLGREGEVCLDYNTNLSRLERGAWNAPALWSRFRNVHVGLSLDGAGAPSELIRSGSDWSQIEKNIQRLRAEAPGVRVYVHCAVSAMNVFLLPDAIDRWIELGLLHWPDAFSIVMVTEPRFLSINILNESERSSLKARFASYLTELKERLRSPSFLVIRHKLANILAWMSKEPWLEERAHFRSFMHQLDRSRQENSRALLAGLEELLVEDGRRPGDLSS